MQILPSGSFAGFVGTFGRLVEALRVNGFRVRGVGIDATRSYCNQDALCY